MTLILVEEIAIFITFISCLYLIYQHRNYKDELMFLKNDLRNKERDIANAAECIYNMNIDVELISAKIDSHLSNPKCCKEQPNSFEIDGEVEELKDLRRLFPEKLDGHDSINFTIEYDSNLRRYSNVDILKSVQQKLESNSIFIPITVLYNILQKKDKKDKNQIYLRTLYVRHKKKIYDKHRRQKK